LGEVTVAEDGEGLAALGDAEATTTREEVTAVQARGASNWLTGISQLEQVEKVAALGLLTVLDWIAAAAIRTKNLAIGAAATTGLAQGATCQDGGKGAGVDLGGRHQSSTAS
jgi:hypothetical protein